MTGTRARSGNAMARTRAAILNAAQHSIERSGVKRTSMSEVATTAGVAKATLYNHFRTKEDVLAALVETRVTELADQAAGIAAGTAPQVPGQPDRGQGLAAALIFVTDALAGSLALRRLAVDEPAVLMRLAAPTVADGWPVARRAASQVLVAAGLEAAPVTADLVLRHLVQHLVWPST
ncbi:MAG: transcriptional regulator, TetR family, partial [Frankiales bacterium]|nr:transcriptional regulator, TetR family [Frankiales bacterium]